MRPSFHKRELQGPDSKQPAQRLAGSEVELEQQLVCPASSSGPERGSEHFSGGTGNTPGQGVWIGRLVQSAGMLSSIG